MTDRKRHTLTHVQRMRQGAAYKAVNRGESRPVRRPIRRGMA